MKDEDFANDLYHLAEAIDYAKGGGYDVGTGVDYSNDVFTMYGYWAHSECFTCDDYQWEAESNVLKAHGFTDEQLETPWEFREKYPDNYHDLYDAELERISEPHDCPYQEWNFIHHPTGLKVKWYKRIGRGTESSDTMKTLDWYQVLLECLESVKRDYEGGGKNVH